MSEYCNKLKSKKTALFNKVTDKDVFNLKSFLIKSGKTIYTYDNFNFEVFISSLKLYLHNELKLSTDAEERKDGIIQINFRSISSLAEKLNVAEKYSLLFLKENLFLKTEIIPYIFLEKGEQKSKFNPAKLLNTSYRKNIVEFAENKVFSGYSKTNSEELNELENIFVETSALNERILRKQLVKGEQILCNLHFQNIKQNREKKDIKELSSGFVVADKNHIFLILLNKNDDIIDCFEINKPISINKNLLRTTVIIENYTISPKRQNSNLFTKLIDIQKVRGIERIRKTAELNYYEKKYKGAAELLKQLIKQENNPNDNFLLLLSDFKTNKQSLQDFISENELSETINNILNNKEDDNFLNIFSDNYKISFKDRIVFLNLFSETAKTDAAQKKVFLFYKAIRPKFIKKNKNKINRIVFDVKYAEFLIKSNRKHTAKKILKKILKDLPDETVSALLPPQDLDLTGDYSGQFLKVRILDLLAQVKGTENSAKEIQKTGVLQPLNKNRIEHLTTVSDIKSRAEEALDILIGKSLFSNTDPVCKTTFNPLSDTDIKLRLVINTGKKNNTFYNLQKWISKVKEDDYSTVKKYSEKITSETHNTLFAVLKNTSTVFNLNDTEFYITKGERKNKIIGYAGNPPFILIGSEHTDRDSRLYMNLSELRFSVASESAHIYFKHTKLTSKDVWRGLTDKGALFADTALAVIPAAGVISKAIQNVPRLNLLSKIFKATATGISTGKTAYDAALKISEFYGKIKTGSKTEKRQSLLAASGIMQYTADRAGLLLCGNLTSAVKAVFLNGDFEETVFKEIKQTSLQDFLLKQNSDGTYKHQQTALRIANLFSFYFSDDYEYLRAKLENDK